MPKDMKMLKAAIEEEDGELSDSSTSVSSEDEPDLQVAVAIRFVKFITWKKIYHYFSASLKRSIATMSM